MNSESKYEYIYNPCLKARSILQNTQNVKNAIYTVKNDLICFQYESIFNFFTAGTMASKSSISVRKTRIRKEELYLVIGSDEMRIFKQSKPQTQKQQH